MVQKMSCAQCLKIIQKVSFYQQATIASLSPQKLFIGNIQLVDFDVDFGGIRVQL